MKKKLLYPLRNVAKNKRNFIFFRKSPKVTKNLKVHLSHNFLKLYVLLRQAKSWPIGWS